MIAPVDPLDRHLARLYLAKPRSADKILSESELQVSLTGHLFHPSRIIVISSSGVPLQGCLSSDPGSTMDVEHHLHHRFAHSA